MQYAETKGPEKQSVTHQERSNQSRNDFRNTQYPDVGQGIFAGMNQRKSVKNEGSRGNKKENPVVEQGQAKNTSGSKGNKNIDQHSFCSAVPDLQITPPGFPGGEINA